MILIFKNQRTSYFSLRGLATHENEPQDLRGYWTRICSLSNFLTFLSTVLTQQSALRSAHPLSSDRGDILKRKVSNIITNGPKLKTMRMFRPVCQAAALGAKSIVSDSILLKHYKANEKVNSKYSNNAKSYLIVQVNYSLSFSAIIYVL